MGSSIERFEQQAEKRKGEKKMKRRCTRFFSISPKKEMLKNLKRRSLGAEKSYCIRRSTGIAKRKSKLHFIFVECMNEKKKKVLEVQAHKGRNGQMPFFIGTRQRLTCPIFMFILDLRTEYKKQYCFNGNWISFVSSFDRFCFTRFLYFHFYFSFVFGFFLFRYFFLYIRSFKKQKKKENSNKSHIGLFLSFYMDTLMGWR